MKTVHTDLKQKPVFFSFFFSLFFSLAVSILLCASLSYFFFVFLFFSISFSLYREPNKTISGTSHGAPADHR